MTELKNNLDHDYELIRELLHKMGEFDTELMRVRNIVVGHLSAQPKQFLLNKEVK